MTTRCVTPSANVQQRNLLMTVFILLLAGCAGVSDPASSTLSIGYTWESGDQGWKIGYADYPAGLTEQDSLSLYALSYGHTELPPEIVPGQKGMKLAGSNRSDDLFMYLYAPVTGLLPLTEYNIWFDLTIASNAPTNAVGIGGPPGEAVTIKAGAVPLEPALRVVDGWYRMKLDKGNQSVGGKDMVVIGHAGVADDTKNYALINRKNSTPFTARTSEDGTLWLILGSDSGYEGYTALYYAGLKLVISYKD